MPIRQAKAGVLEHYLVVVSFLASLNLHRIHTTGIFVTGVTNMPASLVFDEQPGFILLAIYSRGWKSLYLGVNSASVYCPIVRPISNVCFWLTAIPTYYSGNFNKCAYI